MLRDDIETGIEGTKKWILMIERYGAGTCEC